MSLKSESGKIRKSEMSRQHYSFLEEAQENQGFARRGMRFYARFMPGVSWGMA